MGRPILSPGKKLTGGKFRPVTPGRLGLMAMPLKTCFYRDAVFLNQHTKNATKMHGKLCLVGRGMMRCRVVYRGIDVGDTLIVV